jgi:hypothetical protein
VVEVPLPGDPAVLSLAFARGDLTAGGET